MSQLEAQTSQLPPAVREYAEQREVAVREAFERGVLPADVIDLEAHRQARTGRGRATSTEGRVLARIAHEDAAIPTTPDIERSLG